MSPKVTFTQEMELGLVARRDEGVLVRLDYSPETREEGGDPFVFVKLLFDETPPDLTVRRFYRVTITIEDIGDRQ